jgi:hypothetical protein
LKQDYKARSSTCGKRWVVCLVQVAERVSIVVKVYRQLKFGMVGVNESRLKRQVRRMLVYISHIGQSVDGDRGG